MQGDCSIAPLGSVYFPSPPGGSIEDPPIQETWGLLHPGAFYSPCLTCPWTVKDPPQINILNISKLWSDCEMEGVIRIMIY